MYINEASSESPDMVRISEIGKSHQNRPIYAVEIGAGDRGVLSKPALYMDAGHHGNEIITPMVALYFLRYLVAHRDEPPVKGLLDRCAVYIVPCVNPDGYALKQRVNARGVDPNRNYSEAWAESDPKENEYQYGGPTPFSEPETKAIRDFIETHLNIRIGLSLHSGIDRIHYPRTEITNHKFQIPKGDIYKYLSETGQPLTRNLGCSMSGISPLTVAPTGGGRGTTISWLHSRGVYAFTIECYGDGTYPWLDMEKYYPPEEHIAHICSRWVPFNMFMLDAAGSLEELAR